MDMFSEDLENRDYMQNLKDKAKFRSSEVKTENIEEEEMAEKEQNEEAIRINIGEYSYVNLPLDIDLKEGKAIISKAVILLASVDETDEEEEETKKPPKKDKKKAKKEVEEDDEDDDDEEEEDVKSKKKKKSSSKKKGGDKDLEYFPKFQKGDKATLTIKEATGTHDGEGDNGAYTMYFFLVEDEDGNDKKLSTNENVGKTLTRLLKKVDDPEVIIKRGKKNFGNYHIMYEGEDLLED